MHRLPSSFTAFLPQGLPLCWASLMDTRRPPALAGLRQGQREREPLGSSRAVTVHPDASFAMQEVAAELARNKAELDRVQRQAQKERARRRQQREHAFLTATIAFAHEPTAGPTIAAATVRKYAKAVCEDVTTVTHEIETRFLQTPVDTLAQWLDWSDIPRTIQKEAERLVQDARLLHWIGEQNSAQGVAPAPQFVWEKRCALAIDKNTGFQRCAASWRPSGSHAALKWIQRFRQRWSLCLGRLPAKDVLPTETMQAKAPFWVPPKKINSGPTLPTISGAAWRPPFLGRVYIFGKGGGSKTEPVFA